MAEQSEGDRVLIRPYVLPEGDSDFIDEPPPEPDPEPAAEDGTLEVPVLPTPTPPGAPRSHAVTGDNDRRQMFWLIGSGLALVVAVVVTMFALWPGAEDEEPPAANAPVLGLPGAGPQPTGSAAPTGSASASSASASTSPSPSRSGQTSGPAGPGTTGPGKSGPPSAQAPAAPPAPTTVPPPSSDRTGPITGGGDCLDIDAGIILLGDNLAHRDCNGTSSQRWTLAADGTLRVSGSCAQSAAGEVKLQSCGTGDAGQWRARSGNTLINVGTGQCLTRQENGDVVLAQCGGGGQTWALP